MSSDPVIKADIETGTFAFDSLITNDHLYNAADQVVRFVDTVRQHLDKQYLSSGEVPAVFAGIADYVQHEFPNAQFSQTEVNGLLEGVNNTVTFSLYTDEQKQVVNNLLSQFVGLLKQETTPPPPAV